MSVKHNQWIAFVPYYLLVVILFLGIAGLGSKTVTTWNQKSPVQRNRRIIVDAGHGGIDGGTTSCTGMLESHINLEIALRLNDLFHFLGYETVMIRTTDESIYTQGNTIATQKVSDLQERVKIANNTQGGILVSIHQNYFSQSQYQGLQVFYSDSQESKALAEHVQSTSKLLLSNQRASKKASGVYLLEHVTCPAILVECGFLSNPVEATLLCTADYQKKICAVIATSVSNYLDQRSTD